MPARTRLQPIQRPRLDQDVVPFTEYRRTLNDWFARTAKTHRPVVITQNGRATNVMISIADFESTWDEIDRCREREELTRAISISRRQFDATLKMCASLRQRVLLRCCHDKFGSMPKTGAC